MNLVRFGTGDEVAPRINNDVMFSVPSSKARGRQHALALTVATDQATRISKVVGVPRV